MEVYSPGKRDLKVEIELERVQYNQPIDQSLVLHILAQKHVTTSNHCRGQQDAIPPTEPMPILNSPSVVRDFRIVTGRAKLAPRPNE
jgi:hypothetical protein